MPLDAIKLSARDKSILAGLYLSKFDVKGFEFLGFSSFTEAYNAIGLALSAKPASIKNYRDEFDPYFQNARQGWHKRPMREYCRKIYEAFKDLTLRPFADFLRQAVYENHDLDLLIETTAKLSGDETGSTFAKRLITGQAAENFFVTHYSEFAEFRDFSIENTTMMGCGFDFKLRRGTESDFLGVEVKGLNLTSGMVSMTQKEHLIASILKNRFYLVVVKNFCDKPFCDIYHNPLDSRLVFKRTEKTVVQINWSVSV
jgi:Domain of unknown function (DUF3883)